MCTSDSSASIRSFEAVCRSSAIFKRPLIIPDSDSAASNFDCGFLLQCVAVCCSVLQGVMQYCRVILLHLFSTVQFRQRYCVAECCRVLPCVAECCRVVQCGVVCDALLQVTPVSTAVVRCRVLQSVAVCCRVRCSVAE